MILQNLQNDFKGSNWKREIDVRDFIQSNYEAYDGDESFLVGPTERTTHLWNLLSKMFEVEREKGVYDAETTLPQSIDTYGAGYIDRESEVVVGLQTDVPLKRGIFPKGGIRMVEKALKSYGYDLDPATKTIFTKYRKTHNEGVFSAYNDDIKAARHAHIITGLPDAYGRGRIIGDYRRIALYGTANLIEEKKRYFKRIDIQEFTEEIVRHREEVSEQIQALKQFERMCAAYGFDVTRPAQNAREAVQWTYFGYLGAVKDQDGAAMSLGRVCAFLDIYIQRDLKNGVITEEEAQELIDQMIMKLRIVRFLRTPEYNDLFSGDPIWATASIGGMGIDGRSMVTKTDYRFLHTLYNMGPSPEPNLTVLWSERLPESWKKYCAKVSIDTSAIQYENDDLMRADLGDDYGIACCVSPMKIGKQMQFFGARFNLPKLLLLAINGGYDNVTGMKIGPQMEPLQGDKLDYYEVRGRLDIYREWLCKLYVNTMNVIHYMHDKYAYEKTQMALHDTDVDRMMAFGIAGLSVMADSLSAIKYADVKPIRDENGYIIDFDTKGDFPKFGNDDNRVDKIAQNIIQRVSTELRKNPTYRNARHTLSALTITSNVVYGKKTGSTPDGRKKGEPFAPGANPMHNRETNGAIASLNSVSKLQYDYCRDGISNTFSIVPDALGKTDEQRVENLVAVLDGYFSNYAHHLNVNVLNKEMLIEAYENPEAYPNLTIRVSGYAVNFHKLTKEQQREVISRTFHTVM